MKRVHSPEEDSTDHSPKKPTKRMKPESVKVTKESLREGTQSFVILILEAIFLKNMRQENDCVATCYLSRNR